eukprot:519505_1
MNQLNNDLQFLLVNTNFAGDTKHMSFKDERKQRLVSIFTTTSVQYIKVLNEQFKLMSKDSLTTFIDNKLGRQSTTGYYCKTRILYSLNAPDYYAQKINNLGKNYRKNQKQIIYIFIKRMEIDLELIQKIWKMKKYGEGKDMKTWIVSKTAGSSSGYFLTKMLDNCKRYTSTKLNEGSETNTNNSSLYQFTSADIAQAINVWVRNDIKYKVHLIKTTDIFAVCQLDGKLLSILEISNSKKMVKNDLLSFMTKETVHIMFECFANWIRQEPENVKSKTAAEIGEILFNYPLNKLLKRIKNENINGQ